MQKKELLNIIIIVLDAGRPDYLGCYGFDEELSPAIDNLAFQGVIFKNATTVAPWTVPSHASMFTGLYPNQHRATWNTLCIREGIKNLFVLLEKKGYHSMATVANDNLLIPRNRMFSPDTEIFGLTERRNLEVSGFIDGFSAEETHSDIITDWFINWFKRRKGPFIAYFNYYDLHSKYEPREPFRSRFISKQDLETLEHLGDRFDLHFKELNHEVKITPKYISALRAAYKAKLASIDSSINRLINVLKREKILDSSLIIITSDHGDTLGDHQYPSFHHQFSIYNALLRIPLIFYSPIILSPKIIDIPLIQNIDIFPTIFEILDIKIKKGYYLSPAVSLVPYLYDKKIIAPRKFAIAMYEAPRKFVDWNKKSVNQKYFRNLFSIQDKKYKLIFSNSDSKVELYDIEQDPHEQVDISEKFPHKGKRMRESFLKIIKNYGGLSEDYKEGFHFTEDEEKIIKERLKSLGYIQ